MPGLLARYLSVTILKRYLLFTSIALIVATLIEFLENRDGLMDEPTLSAADVVRFSILSSPGIFLFLAGFIALVSMLVSCMTLVRYSELKAILSSGLSYRNLVCALLPAAFAMAGFHFLMDNLALPAATAELRDWGVGNMARERPGDTDAIWVRQGNNILAIGNLRIQSRSLADVQVFALAKSGRLAWHLTGQTASFSGDGLLFPSAVRTVTGKARPSLERNVTFATPLDFDMVAALSLRPRQASVWSIARVLGQTSAASYPRYVYQFWFQKKLSAPFVTALVVLLLAPLAKYVHRIGNLRLLLMGLAGGFLYFVADAVLAAFGEAGVVPPIAAAWALLVLLALLVIIPVFTEGGARRHLTG